ncbi:hypothetical protein CLOBOL_07029 [Enterocloster bolteae ATCC BAA-613]|uniref:Uncharacterized protein n=1 Tax=Enterocloster bolteae (strain ATCC BAA-613 / DSM 15670 / CCUG 46953 / JCM 12243 / WAL 16351) TaxID=411902 RepID=A8S4N2_ENTBW|nr:hypothetical protein CLOBOL_07029 [Enterocloster bolteae ATCC BAA-613]
MTDTLCNGDTVSCRPANKRAEGLPIAKPCPIRNGGLMEQGLQRPYYISLFV